MLEEDELLKKTTTTEESCCYLLVNNPPVWKRKRCFPAHESRSSVLVVDTFSALKATLDARALPAFPLYLSVKKDALPVFVSWTLWERRTRSPKPKDHSRTRRQQCWTASGYFGFVLYSGRKWRHVVHLSYSCRAFLLSLKTKWDAEE